MVLDDSYSPARLYLVPDSTPAMRIPSSRDVPGGYVTLNHLDQDAYLTEEEPNDQTLDETNTQTLQEAATQTGSTVVSTFGGHTHSFGHTHDFTHTHTFTHAHSYPNKTLQGNDRVFLMWAGDTVPVILGTVFHSAVTQAP